MSMAGMSIQSQRGKGDWSHQQGWWEKLLDSVHLPCQEDIGPIVSLPCHVQGLQSTSELLVLSLSTVSDPRLPNAPALLLVLATHAMQCCLSQLIPSYAVASAC
jgi:hypothetical protein